MPNQLFWTGVAVLAGVTVTLVAWRLTLRAQRRGPEPWRLHAVLAGFAINLGSSAIVFAGIEFYSFVRGDVDRYLLARIDLLVAGLVLAVAVLLTAICALLKPTPQLLRMSWFLLFQDMAVAPLVYMAGSAVTQIERPTQSVNLFKETRVQASASRDAGTENAAPPPPCDYTYTLVRYRWSGRKVERETTIISYLNAGVPLWTRNSLATYDERLVWGVGSVPATTVFANTPYVPQKAGTGLQYYRTREVAPRVRDKSEPADCRGYERVRFTNSACARSAVLLDFSELADNCATLFASSPRVEQWSETFDCDEEGVVAIPDSDDCVWAYRTDLRDAQVRWRFADSVRPIALSPE